MFNDLNHDLVSQYIIFKLLKRHTTVFIRCLEDGIEEGIEKGYYIAAKSHQRLVSIHVLKVTIWKLKEPLI